jgi:hypothetical protein
MRKIVVLYSLIILTFLSCKKDNVKEKIIGVWFSEYSINTLYSSGIYEDSVLFFQQNFPVVYDFKDNGDLFLKRFRGNDTIFKWSLKSDSIVTINRLDFHINYLSHDSINLIYKDKHNYQEFSYIRPKEIQIKQTKSEIEKILLSKIWTTNDSANKDIREHFEFLDNQTMIYRYKFDVEYDSISPDNLQLETWGIAKYKNYAFLYNFHDMKIGNGNITSCNQIVDVDSVSFTIFTSFPNSETKYIRKKTPDNKEAIKKIIGNWTSINTRKKSYGRFSENQLKRGEIALYEGKLNLTITTDSLSYRIHDQNPMAYNWQLSKDGRILVFEYKVDEPELKGIHVEYADILELTDNKLKIRLFDNHYFTYLNKPRYYLLNLIQEFEKND